MSMRIPLMFTRQIRCTEENGLKPNSGPDYPWRMIHVVMLPLHTDGKFYNTKWMGSDHVLGQCKNDENSDYVYIPDVDIVDDKDIYVFDGDDAEKNYLGALRKMRELWMQMEIPADPTPFAEETADNPNALSHRLSA